MRILLAIDGSSCSEVAINEVVTRPWPANSEVEVFSAVKPVWYMAPEPWVGAQDYYAQVDKLEHDKTNSVVTSAVAKLEARPDKTLKITSSVKDGSPKQVIVEEAEKWGADLIVLGSHGYGSWNRLLLGSVSQVVSTHAPCSVEIVRCQVGSQDHA